MIPMKLLQLTNRKEQRVITIRAESTNEETLLHNTILERPYTDMDLEREDNYQEDNDNQPREEIIDDDAKEKPTTTEEPERRIDPEAEMQRWRKEAGIKNNEHACEEQDKPYYLDKLDNRMPEE